MDAALLEDFKNHGYRQAVEIVFHNGEHFDVRKTTKDEQLWAAVLEPSLIAVKFTNEIGIISDEVIISPHIQIKWV